MSTLKPRLRTDGPMDWEGWRKAAEDVLSGKTDHFEPPEAPGLQDYLDLLNERDNWRRLCKEIDTAREELVQQYEPRR